MALGLPFRKRSKSSSCASIPTTTVKSSIVGRRTATVTDVVVKDLVRRHDPDARSSLAWLGHFGMNIELQLAWDWRIYA
jgi:hypothetical protein